MNREQLQQYKGKNVCVFLNNEKNIYGIVVELSERQVKLQTDYGVLSIENDKITTVSCVDQLKDLFVYTCRNIALKCKGVRLVSSKSKLNWPCKYFKQFQCQISKVCNYNDIPLRIKNDFIDGMHSEIPVVGSLKK